MWNMRRFSAACEYWRRTDQWPSVGSSKQRNWPPPSFCARERERESFGLSWADTPFSSYPSLRPLHAFCRLTYPINNRLNDPPAIKLPSTPPQLCFLSRAFSIYIQLRPLRTPSICSSIYAFLRANGQTIPRFTVPTACTDAETYTHTSTFDV